MWAGAPGPVTIMPGLGSRLLLSLSLVSLTLLKHFMNVHVQICSLSPVGVVRKHKAQRSHADTLKRDTHVFIS